MSRTGTALLERLEKDAEFCRTFYAIEDRNEALFFPQQHFEETKPMSLLRTFHIPSVDNSGFINISESLDKQQVTLSISGNNPALTLNFDGFQSLCDLKWKDIIKPEETVH